MFHRYGGRGITIYPEWRHSFPTFLKYIEENLGPRPKSKSLDRYPNCDGNYEPGNLRWATPKEQNLNKHLRTRPDWGIFKHPRAGSYKVTFTNVHGVRVYSRGYITALEEAIWMRDMAQHVTQNGFDV